MYGVFWARRPAALRWLLLLRERGNSHHREREKAHGRSRMALRCLHGLNLPNVDQKYPAACARVRDSMCLLPWAKRDSNPRLPACKAGALTN